MMRVLRSPNCSRKSVFLLRHWRSVTCSPFSLNNLKKHSVWSLSLHFATHSHSHPLAILTSFGLFCDSKWNLHIFFPDLMQQRIPWAKIDGSNLFFFLFSAALYLNFQNTTLKLEPFCWYIGRWIETKCSALYCFWNKAWIFINLQWNGNIMSRDTTKPHYSGAGQSQKQLSLHLLASSPAISPSNFVRALKWSNLSPNVLVCT